MSYMFLGLAVLVLVAGFVVRRRIHRRTRSGGFEVTDEVVRQIEREGRVRTDEREPLDRDRIREEEDRFWSETWDEPESFWG